MSILSMQNKFIFFFVILNFMQMRMISNRQTASLAVSEVPLSSGEIYNRSCFCAIMEHLLLIGCKRIVITLNVSRKRFFITGKKSVALCTVLSFFYIYIYV